MGDIKISGKTIEMITMPFKFAPMYSIIIALQKILQGLIPTFQLVAIAKFLDTAIGVVNGTYNKNEIIIPLITIVMLIAFDWISQQLVGFVEVRLELRLREKLRGLITEKKAKLKYKYIEDKEAWDLISRISEDPELKCKSTYIDLLDSISLIVRVTGLIFILITKVWWAALLILAISIPLFYLSIKSGKANYDAFREMAEYRRESDYIGDVITGRESADERALFRYTSELNKKWLKLYEKVRKHQLKIELKWFAKMKLGGIITALISIIIVVILLVPVKDGLLTVGMFISISNSVFDIIQIMSWQLTAYTENLVKNREHLKDLAKFMSLDESIGAIDKPTIGSVKLEKLEFKNVSFKYPGTERYILKDLSFVIEVGKHYSFVGINGAGKTTITKIITGLYDEFEGEILINEIDIKKYSQCELKELTSVVYQDFAKYSISIKDNIALGNLECMHDRLKENQLKEAINIVELDDVVDKLDKGLETNLGKIKSDGLDISGGQWQRIAMARAIVSNASLRILDEPTAALDPISESNVYERFEKISKGQTTIFISHRLGSTKLADEIFVIENGSIIETGNHEDLISMAGKYANMYESQRSWYL